MSFEQKYASSKLDLSGKLNMALNTSGYEDHAFQSVQLGSPSCSRGDFDRDSAIFQILQVTL